MTSSFKPRYFKDPGGPLPPGFWIACIIAIVLFACCHACKGGVFI